MTLAGTTLSMRADSITCRVHNDRVMHETRSVITCIMLETDLLCLACLGSHKVDIDLPTNFLEKKFFLRVDDPDDPRSVAVLVRHV